MKKLIIFLLIAIICKNVDAEKVDGRVILNNGEEIIGTIDLPLDLMTRAINYQKLQHKIKFYDTEKQRKMKLTPDRAREIVFFYGDKEFKMLSVKNNLGLGTSASDKNIFLRLEIDGYMKLFTYYTKHSVSLDELKDSPLNLSRQVFEEKFFQKKGGNLKRIRTKREMREYFSDCPEVEKEIEKGKFGSLRIIDRVLFYNNNCHKD